MANWSQCCSWLSLSKKGSRKGSIYVRQIEDLSYGEQVNGSPSVIKDKKREKIVELDVSKMITNGGNELGHDTLQTYATVMDYDNCDRNDDVVLRGRQIDYKRSESDRNSERNSVDNMSETMNPVLSILKNKVGESNFIEMKTDPRSNCYNYKNPKTAFHKTFLTNNKRCYYLLRY